jgi:hypothetical protein
MVAALTLTVAVGDPSKSETPVTPPAAERPPPVADEEWKPMEVVEIVRRFNASKVSDVWKLPDGPFPSERVVTHLIFELSKANEGTLATHWQILPQGWRKSNHKWRLEDFGKSTVGEALNKVIEREGWSYSIHRGYLLVKQFHVSLEQAPEPSEKGR